MAEKRQDEGRCPVCGRALSKWTTHVTLEDEKKICRDCENRIRVLYPLRYGKPSNRKNVKDKRIDRICELTLPQVKASMDLVTQYIEDLREMYGFNAVYKVEDMTMQPHGWFGAPLIFAKGRVIYGYFDVKDKIRVVRKSGTGVAAEIRGIERQSAGEKDLIDWEHRGEPGYPCSCFVFCQKDLVIAPGDLIVK